LYKIRNWSETFEVAQTRKQPREMSWVPMPTRMDGKRYRRIAQHEHGDRILGCWLVMVEIAACRPLERRGYLEDSDGPMGPEDLSAASGLKPESFELAINVLLDKGIGWLIKEALPEQYQSDPNAAGCSGLQDKTNKTRQNRTIAARFEVDCSRFKSEYPKEVSDWGVQILLSEVRTQAEQDLMFSNLGLYCLTDQWKRGIVPSAENWLKKGYWKVAPKETTVVGAGRAKTGVDDTLAWLASRGDS
jgi:hypothetical protein